MQINLSKLHKKYLLTIYRQRDITVSEMAKLFSCSKANISQNLDRMGQQGVVYRDKTGINLTFPGERLAEQYDDTVKQCEETLSRLLPPYCIRDNLVQAMLDEEYEPLMEYLTGIYQRLQKMPSLNGSITSKEMEELIHMDEFNIYFHTFRSELSSGENAFLQSMAQTIFYRGGHVIREEGQYFIHMDTIPIENEKWGRSNKGFLKGIQFQQGGETFSVKGQSSRIKLPFSLIPKWYLIGDGIFQAATKIHMESNINIGINHAHEAVMIFTISLFHLDKEMATKFYQKDAEGHRK